MRKPFRGATGEAIDRIQRHMAAIAMAFEFCQAIDKRVFLYVIEDGPATIPDIAAGLGRDDAPIRDAVWRLVDTGHLVMSDDGEFDVRTPPPTA